MVNAWSLAYDVINGTLDENFPIMTDNTITSRESDEYDPKPKSDKEETDWKDPVITVGSGITDSAGWFNFDLSDEINNVTIDTSNLDLDLNINLDDSVVYAGDAIGDSVYADTWPHAGTVNIDITDEFKVTPGI